MNLTKIAEDGRLGINQGLNIGLGKLNDDMGGLNKGSYIAVAGAPKSGKTTFVNEQFIIQVFLKNPLANVMWIYYSFEMNRTQMAFKFASYFIYKEYGEKLSTNYLIGKAKKNGVLMTLSDRHLEMLQKVENKYIKPLFGEYDSKGNLIKEGKIIFFDKKEKPETIKKYLDSVALKYGKYLYEDYTVTELGKQVVKKKLTGYVPNPDSPHIIVILDHIRKTLKEGSMKETMDKLSENFADFSKDCLFTTIVLAHLNRGISDIDRIKFLKDGIYPNENDLKDSGNVPEDCTELITILNAKDEQYKLKFHFSLDLSQFENNGYRSVHLVLSRYSECPNHYPCNFSGTVGTFTDIDINSQLKS